jgi:hypothetical protein
MRISTKVLFDPITFKAIPVEGYEYEGPIDEMKKGRDEMAQFTQEAQQMLGQLSGNAQQSYGQAQNLLQEDMGSSKPGSLTPAAQAQLASDNDNIARTYGGMRQTAAATAGQRGFGAAPSGFAKTTENGINLGEANAQTGAYRNAQQNTQQQRNLALSGETALSGQQLGGSLGALGAGETGAFDQSRMGSTAGDILQGVAGGIGAATGLGGLFGNIGKTSGAFNLASGLNPSTASSIANGANSGFISGLSTYQPSANKLQY